MHSDDGRSSPSDPPFDGAGTTSGSSGATVSGFGETDAAFASGDEVPSSDMDDNESEVTGELDIPVPPDEPTSAPVTPDPGFDGWLDDDAAAEDSPVDPYASLVEDDDAAAEIADWLAFAGSGGAAPPAEPQPEPKATQEEPPVEAAGFAIVEETVEPEAAPPVVEESAAPVAVPPVVEEIAEPEVTLPVIEEPFAPTSAPPIVEESLVPVPVPPVVEDVAVRGPADSVEADDEDDEDEDTVEFFLDHEDAGETDLEDLEMWSEPAETDGADPPAPSPLDFPIGGVDTPSQPTVDSEQLGVIPVVPIGAAGAVQGTGTGEVPSTPSPAGDATVFDYEADDLTSEHYLHAATREHHELAASVAAARATDTEQVAVSAAIPGLDSAVVGFGDVVDAEGVDAAPAPKGPKSSDLFQRVGTGAALIAAFVLSLLWRPAIIVLALAVFVIAAGEFYSVLMHRHYKPLSIFGFLGILGAGLGTVVWGVVAIPIALILMVTVLLLFNAVSRHRQGSVTGVSLTVLVAAWIGGFGAFAFPIIASDDYVSLVITVVGMVALVDIAAYGVGRSIGRRPFAPNISPKKTLEGFLGGTLMALLAGSAASFFVSAIDLPAGLMLGVVVAIFAPLGDLSVSVVKRSLDIKDMGSILPGHGGLLDRIDAIIAVIPAAWAAMMWLGIL